MVEKFPFRCLKHQRKTNIFLKKDKQDMLTTIDFSGEKRNRNRLDYYLNHRINTAYILYGDNFI